MDMQMIQEGRKTFFIAPDMSFLPETYCEDYLAHGFETYIIDDFRFCPLEVKVDIILSIFPDPVLFFFIDAPVKIKWERYIASLQERHGDKVLIGVLYSKNKTENERRALEKAYLFDIGIHGGCIALEYQKQKNFALIDKVMQAAQSDGKRKTIRAIGSFSSKASFEYSGRPITVNITDISLDHFSFVPPVPMKQFVDIPLYARISGIFMRFNGIHFKTNASLAFKRELNGNMLHIFLFQKADWSKGLEKDLVGRLRERICKSITDAVSAFLRAKFEAYIQNPSGYKYFDEETAKSI